MLIALLWWTTSAILAILLLQSLLVRPRSRWFTLIAIDRFIAALLRSPVSGWRCSNDGYFTAVVLTETLCIYLDAGYLFVGT